MSPRTIARRVARREQSSGLPDAVRRKPLQAAKLVGTLLVIVLGIGGFFRVISAGAVVDDPLLGDGQFLALLLIPIIGVGLVVVVFLEALVTGYRVFRADEPVSEQAAGRAGYVLIRGAEVAVAVVGVLVMLAALPVLFAESTPAPAGVGIMLLLAAVGVGILVTSFVRSFAELFVYDGERNDGDQRSRRRA